MASLCRGALALGLALGMTASKTAHASGIYTVDRGARAMGRGGAFVAGADDLMAMWYNPAGIVEAGNTLYGDLGYLYLKNEWTREIRVEDANKTVRYVKGPTVEGSTPFLPVPNGAMAFNLTKDKQWVLALGMSLPNFALPSYPETVGGQPAPTRNPKFYIDITRSLAAFPGAWIAWKASPQIYVGAGAQAIMGFAGGTARAYANLEDRLLGPPESLDHEVWIKFSAGPFIAPTANAGIIAIPAPNLRLGASAQAPLVLGGPVSFEAKLPPSLSPTSNPIPGEGSFRVVLPAIFRVGAEIRPMSYLRMEATYVREMWSMHESVDVEARNVNVGAVLGTNRLANIAPFSIKRGFVDSNSIRGGAELKLPDPIIEGVEMTMRGGISYDTSAVPPDYVSHLSLDSDKVILSGGGSLHVGKRLRMDGVMSLVFMQPVKVNPDTAKIKRIDPFAEDLPAVESINGGEYKFFGLYIGGGGQISF